MRSITVIVCSLVAAQLACGGAVSPEQSKAPAEPAAIPVFQPVAAADDGCAKEPVHVDVGAPRKLDTRKGPDLPPAQYKKMRWVGSHTKPPAPAFALQPAQAVDAVVALEAKQPKLIPAPYREALLAAPRDAALRLKIGACEAKQPSTRRRAAYEGAIALLLGGSPEEASRLIKLGTHGESTTHTTSFCGKGHDPCAEGSYCDVVYGECVTREEHVYAYISQAEAELETALTRGLIGELGAPHKLSSDARGGWMLYMVHACGVQLCKLTDYEVKGKVSLVVWDIRDGGTVEEVPFTAAELKLRDQCLHNIGFPSQNACKTDCWERFYEFGSAGWKAQDACKASCSEGCSF